jgi:hypothetical protein
MLGLCGQEKIGDDGGRVRCKDVECGLEQGLRSDGGPGKQKMKILTPRCWPVTTRYKEDGQSPIAMKRLSEGRAHGRA